MKRSTLVVDGKPIHWRDVHIYRTMYSGSACVAYTDGRGKSFVAHALTIVEYTRLSGRIVYDIRTTPDPFPRHLQVYRDSHPISPPAPTAESIARMLSY